MDKGFWEMLDQKCQASRAKKQRHESRALISYLPFANISHDTGSFAYTWSESRWNLISLRPPSLILPHQSSVSFLYLPFSGLFGRFSFLLLLIFIDMLFDSSSPCGDSCFRAAASKKIQRTRRVVEKEFLQLEGKVTFWKLRVFLYLSLKKWSLLSRLPATQMYSKQLWLQLFLLFFFTFLDRPAVVFVSRCDRVTAPNFLPVD